MEDTLKTRNKKQHGFTILELLVTVAIILIIVSIALPKFLQSRAAASQASAAATLRTFGTALQAYNTAWNIFPATLIPLGGDCSATPATATLSCQMDTTIVALASGSTFNQYTWTYTQTNSGTGFTMTAAPAAGNNATRNYFLDQNGTTHYADGGVANSSSAVLGN
jgi:prepilin-type N-terminal cleavage/methylation domain-containing protein